MEIFWNTPCLLKEQVYSRLDAARAVNRERRLKLKTVPVPGSGSGSDLTEGSLSGSASKEFDPCS